MGGQQTRRSERTSPNGISARAIAGRLSLLLIAIACSGSDTVAPTRADSGAAPPLTAVASGGDIGGIEQLVEKFEALFNAKNAESYGSLYAEGADFEIPTGAVFEGRAAIVARHAFLFAGPFAPATITAELNDVQFLTGTIAIVDVFTTLTGLAGPPPPGAVVSPDGAVRSRSRWLAEKRRGEWTILLAYHRGSWSL
jgi:uncharacterized protein (TIGR02246 family)